MHTDSVESLPPGGRQSWTADALSAKPWYYLGLFLLLLLPPFAAGGFRWWSVPGEATVDFLGSITEAMFAYTDQFLAYMPWLHLLFVLQLAGLLIWRARFSRLFSILAGLNFALITYLQTMVFTEQYGFFLSTNFFFVFSLVLLLWFWEAYVRRTRFTFRMPALPNLWMPALALFAFWNPETVLDLDPRFLVTSNSVITFCHMVPIYLVILHFQLPQVNWLLYRTMSFLGILMIPIILAVGLHLGGMAGMDWILLHSPLLVIPPYCFVRSWRLGPAAP